MSFISRGLTSHHTGTVPLCSTTGATSSIDRTSMVTFLLPAASSRRLRRRVPGARWADPYAGPPSVSIGRKGVAVGTVRTLVLEPEPLTEAAFARFGWLPVDDTNPRDRDLTYEFAWGDTHVNVISHAPDEVEHTERGAVCAGMYRHDTHTQTLLPLNVESVVAVAPAAVDFSEPEHLEAVRAFRLAPLEPF